MLQSPNQLGSEEQQLQSRSNNYPTMIFCNPNAGFAEYFQYQSDWLDYYIHMGINVFIWNYRGFGLSEGFPDPKVQYNINIYHLENKRRLGGGSSPCKVEKLECQGRSSWVIYGWTCSSTFSKERSCGLFVCRQNIQFAGRCACLLHGCLG